MEISQNKTVVDEVDITTLRGPKPRDVAHSSRKLLWLFGLYSGKLIRRHPFPKITHLTVVLILASLPVLMVGKLFSDDRPKLLEGWGILWALAFHLIKLLAYSWSKSINDVERMLQSKIFNIHTGSQDRFLSRAVRHLELFAMSTRPICGVLSILFVIFVPVNPKSLPLPIWTPVDLNPIFWHVYEVIALIVSVFLYITVDSTILAFIANTTAQFQILKDNLENSCTRNPEESYFEQEIKIQLRLVRCVRHHNAILVYLNKMESSLSTIIFCQICFSTLGICLSAFEYHLVPTRSMPFVWCLVYSAGYLVQILSWCMLAEDVTVQGAEIANSCFMADWYACNSKTKKMLLIVMQKTTEPIILKAGPFFTLSLRTFVMILRSAYTYYAVLHHVYKQ